MVIRGHTKQCKILSIVQGIKGKLLVNTEYSYVVELFEISGAFKVWDAISLNIVSIAGLTVDLISYRHTGQSWCDLNHCLSLSAVNT